MVWADVVGGSFTAVTLVANVTAVPANAPVNDAVVCAVSLVSKMKLEMFWPVVSTLKPSWPSQTRIVSDPGVPFQLAAGTNRTLSAGARIVAFVSETLVARLLQLTPLVEYCQTPWPAVAALPLIAT